MIFSLWGFSSSLCLLVYRGLGNSWLKKISRLALVGGFNHLEKYQSMGRIISYIMENKSHVWNHQPEPLPTEGVYIYIDHRPHVWKLTIFQIILGAMPMMIGSYPCIYLVGGFNPSEKYESQIGSSSKLLGKIKKNVPNHQAVISSYSIRLRQNDLDKCPGLWINRAISLVQNSELYQGVH